MTTNPLTPGRWAVLNSLRDGLPHTDIEHLHTKIVKSLIRRGMAVGNTSPGQRWLAITDAGKAALARVDRMDPQPKYAGGPGNRGGRPTRASTRVAGAPTPVAPACAMVAEVKVHMGAKVLLPVGSPCDGQAMKQAVERLIAQHGVGPLIQGWDLIAVLDEKHNMLVGPSHG